MAALAGHQTLSFKLFATGHVLSVDARSLTLITAGLNALTLITGFAVFAAIPPDAGLRPAAGLRRLPPGHPDRR
jgi:hypothetical protein